jgi:biotin carboxyl carrier protein
MKYVTIINGERFEVEIDKDGNLLVNGEPRDVDFRPLGSSQYSIIMNNQSFQAVIDEERGMYSVMILGRLYEGQVLDERAMLMAQRRAPVAGGSGELQAPMPGLIIKVGVEVGQEVRQGKTCVILESMKMQNELKAPVDGIVKAVFVESGQTVDKNDVLLTIEPANNNE